MITNEYNDTTFSYLKRIGASYEVLNQIENINELNIDDIKEKCQILLSLRYTRLEINKILAENINYIYSDLNVIKNNLKKYFEKYKNEYWIKNVLYSIPEIFTYNQKIDDITAILDKYNIDSSLVPYILSQNNMIYLDNTETLEKSMELIKNISQSEDVFQTMIVEIPEIIGVLDSKNMLSIINFI